MKHIRLQLSFLMAIGCLSSVVPQASAQKVNSLYFLENTPIQTKLNPAMAPKYSGFGIGLSDFSYYVQSDLAFDDLFYPGPNGELQTFMHPDVDKQAFLDGLNDVTNIRTGMNLDFFNLGIRLKNNYFSLHSGINMDLGMQLPKDLFRLVLQGMDANAASTLFDLTSTNVNMMVYNKTGVGFATKIGSMFSVGVNANYLAGIANTKIKFDQLTINAAQSGWDVTSKGSIELAGPEQLNLSYSEDGYLDGIDETFSSSKSQTVSDYSSLPQAGSGFSVDLGMTAKLLPFLTLSASITDLGAINWKKKYIQKASSNGTFTYDGLDIDFSDNSGNNDDQSKLSDEIKDLVRFEKQNVTKGYSSRLTTKLNLGAEAGVLNNHITFGVLSQTGFAEDGTYQDLMLSANLKPGSALQTAFTYSLLHGSMNSFGAAISTKLLFLNIFFAADYIPTKYSPQMIPVNNSYFNTQFGFNFMF
ncbi:MAG: DUF5723 family protein [Bacteroidota bacterium]|nr:DUF5723 family protein [Bacteroidota bacterium]